MCKKKMGRVQKESFYLLGLRAPVRSSVAVAAHEKIFGCQAHHRIDHDIS